MQSEKEILKIKTNNETSEDEIKNKKFQESEESVSFFRLEYFFLNKTEKLLMSLAIIGSFGTGISLPLFALFFGESISKLNFITSFQGFQDIFFQLLLKFIYVGISTLAGGFLMYFLWTYIGRVIGKKFRESYFKLIMRQEQGWFDKENTYEFSFKVQNQVKMVENGVGMKVGHTIMAITMFISSFIVGYYTSWKLSLVITSIIPFFVLGGWLIDKVMSSRERIQKEKYENAGGVAEEVLYHIKTVASFANFEYEIERFNKSIDESRAFSINNGKRAGILMGVYFFVIFGTFALAVWYCSTLILSGEKNFRTGLPLGVGEFLVVLFTIVFGSLALGQASPNAKAISNACIAANDYFQLKKRKIEIDLSTAVGKFEIIDKVVKFENVNFAYPARPDRLVLKNFSASFGVGKTSIVGENGSGKSTVACLIQRFYDLKSYNYDGTLILPGMISIDNHDIKTFDLEYLRSQIGYCPQEPVLFNISIRENIKFGRDYITDDDIMRACRLVLADEFINKIANGLDYIVGSKGSKLSGGQKQRIALARAIVSNPKILILDESTSALDFRSEREVQFSLDRISQEMTTIVIANRLSTILNSDQIYVLSKGEIVERGTHEELIKQGGIYTALVQTQLDKQKFIHAGEVREDYTEIIRREVNGQSPVVAQPSSSSDSVHPECQSILQEESGDNKNKDIQASIQNISQPENKEFEKLVNIRSRVWSMLKENILLVIFAVFFSAATGANWSAYGILLAVSVDALSSVSHLKQNGEEMAGWFVLVAAITGVLMIGENLTSKLRKNLFKKFLRFQMEFFDRIENSPGALLSQLSSDTAKINGIAISMVGSSVQIISTFIISFIISIIYDWRLALIFLAFIPVTALATFFMFRAQKFLKDSNEKIIKESGGLMTESILNTKLVFAFNMQEKVVERYISILESQNNLIMKSSIMNGISFGVVLLIMFFTFGTLLYSGAVFIEGGLSVGNMLRSVFPLLFAILGLTLSQQYVGDMSGAKEAIEHIFRTLEEPSEIDPLDKEGKIVAKNLSGKIEFRGVCFSYPQRPHQIILNNINFVINPGESVGLIGFSGSGKSTIIQLLERFYDPTFGSILVDDVDIKSYDLVSLRKSIGLLMEEPVLFKRSLVENIKYGKLDADMKEVKDAAEKANISYLLSSDRLNSELPISGGEKQRISLARTIIKSPVILILDEPTAALDKKSEEAIESSMNILKSNKTTIQIAHKLSTIEKSDCIYVLEDGNLIESGRHEDLIEKRGKYFSLYKAGNR